MTPERLKELRDWMERAKTATTFGLERADLAALLDHVEAQEKALQAADKMREEMEKPYWEQTMVAEIAYDEARAEVKR